MVISASVAYRVSRWGAPRMNNEWVWKWLCQIRERTFSGLIKNPPYAFQKGEGHIFSSSRTDLLYLCCIILKWDWVDRCSEIGRKPTHASLLVVSLPLEDKVSSLICDQLYCLPWQRQVCRPSKRRPGESGIADSLWDYLKLASN